MPKAPKDDQPDLVAALTRGGGGAGAGAAPAGVGGWSVRWHGGGKYAIAQRAHGPVLIWFASGAKPAEKLQAAWHACVLRQLGGGGGGGAAEAELHARAEAAWPAVHASLSAAGWAVENVFLDGDGGFLALAEDGE